MMACILLWWSPLAFSTDVCWEDCDRPVGSSTFVASDGVNLRNAPSLAGEVRTELPLGAPVTVLGAGKAQTIGERTAPWYRVKTASGEGFVWGGVLTNARVEVDLDSDGVKEIAVLAFRSDHHQMVRLAEGGAPVQQLDLGADEDVQGALDTLSLSVTTAEETGVPLLVVRVLGREECETRSHVYWVSFFDGVPRQAVDGYFWNDEPVWRRCSVTFDPTEKTATRAETAWGWEDDEEAAETKTTRLVFDNGVFVSAG